MKYYWGFLGRKLQAFRRLKEMSQQLSGYLAKLKANKEKTKEVNNESLIFWGTRDDEPYLPYLKSCVGSSTVHLRLDPATAMSQIIMVAKQKLTTKLVTTNVSILKMLLKWDKKKEPSLKDYAGSYFKIPANQIYDQDVEVVIIAPLRQLITVNYGLFMAKRQISKLTSPNIWYKPTAFNGYILLTPAKEAELYAALTSSFLIAVDVETLREHAQIKCISYTGFFQDATHPSGMKSISVELALDSEWALAVMRKWNMLAAPKVFQNGKYDIAYFARYNAPVHNYLYDTQTMMHCMYSELPKDLGFLNSFFIREAFYWKDLADTDDLDTYYRYNSLDTWGTGNTFIAQLLEAKPYALDNYLLEFPLIFPCHMCEMRGIKRDMSKMEAAVAEQNAIIATKQASLNKILGIPAGKNFNVKSPVQMKALFKLLGCSDLKSQDEKNVKKARFRHPFNARVLNLVLDIREARTLIEKYLQTGDKAKEFHRFDGSGDMVLYSLNPHGTDSGRLASKEHHFWVGLQVQNIPAGQSIKCTLQSRTGFRMAECDLEQAESRDTAYISGDEKLIDAVEFSPDFHSANASAFFGVPFELIFDAVTHKKLDVALRDLAKRVNHGANYNMGAFILLETMGEEKVLQARRLLNLPKLWTLKRVCEHLLEAFHKTYPKIAGVFYKQMTLEVMRTKKLTCRAWHHKWTDNKDVLEAKNVNGTYEVEYPKQAVWTRVCFGKPDQNKMDLNSYISHPPQSLNAMTLNKAFLSVFNDIAMHPIHSNNFILYAQIHDSILFDYRKGHEYLCDMVRERMEIPTTIKGYDDVVRTFVVPAAIKNGSKSDKGYATYWSETE